MRPRSVFAARQPLAVAGLVTLGCTVVGLGPRDAAAQRRESREHRTERHTAQQTGQDSTPSITARIAVGDSAWKSGDYRTAKSAYADVVRRDPDASSRAVFRLATLLSYDDQLEEAIALFRQYIRLEPGDDAGRIALARTLAWAGKYDAAIAVYDTVLARDTSNGEAAKGIARILAWRGDLPASEARWRALTARTPRDADAWVGLAQVMRWSGRPAGARDALQQALDADPQNLDAREQLRRVDAELAPSVHLDVIPTGDSDHNNAVWYAATFTVRPPWNGQLALVAGERSASFQTINGRSLGAKARGRWTLGTGRWAVQGEVGATHLSADTAGVDGTVHQPTRLVAGAGVSGQLTPRLSAGISGTRAPFDETAALILHGITMTSGDADLSLALPARLTLSAGAGAARLTGGTTDNTRRSSLLSLRYTVSRRWSVAATTRGFGYDTTVTDGYFSPTRFVLNEGSVRGRFGGELGWQGGGELGLGAQQVRLLGNTTSRAAQRAALDVGYQFAPGYGMSVRGIVANLPSTQTVSPDGYRWYSIGVSGQLLLR